MPLSVLAEAEREAATAEAHYAAISPALGVRFVDELEDCLDRIDRGGSSYARHPGAAGPETRFLQLRSFPYLVLYSTADPAETVVFSVFHTASGPARLAAAERRT